MALRGICLTTRTLRKTHFRHLRAQQSCSGKRPSENQIRWEDLQRDARRSTVVQLRTQGVQMQTHCQLEALQVQKGERASFQCAVCTLRNVDRHRIMRLKDSKSKLFNPQKSNDLMVLHEHLAVLVTSRRTNVLGSCQHRNGLPADENFCVLDSQLAI